ncbi:Pnap_2097 family protein [Mangrovicoccus sp. HB161399]|uniref:Pnap_2097 family protein n=1 Tax=Mangrovicoccus sp. HB161399 TaxID=2720392 RepID=UPI0015571F2A|nr:Pnap_2097 family protein [Mangrovicoccus sp. HB161399]
MTRVLAFPAPPAPVLLEDSQPLSMMQLAPRGLSEQWLLRHAGDRHWAMIAAAMGQGRAVFADADGRPVYAAFCATELAFAPPEPLLGADLSVRSSLHAVSARLIGSEHLLSGPDGPIGMLRMVSTFVSHDGTGSNKRITRNLPSGELRLPDAPAALAELAGRARSRARTLRDRSSRGPVLLRARPCPQTDFNAAGLLYFPTFSRLAETADWAETGSDAPLAWREVTYLGNLDQGEEVEVCRAEGGLDILRGDGRIIAHLRTARHPS